MSNNLMQLIINIPKETYKATCSGCMLPPDVENVVQGIKNGIIVPKMLQMEI